MRVKFQSLGLPARAWPPWSLQRPFPRKRLAPAAPAPAPAGAGRPTFRVQVDLVTNDVVIRDEKGNFIPDLKPEDFEVYEDGVLQDLASMTVVTGGRVYNPMSAPDCGRARRDHPSAEARRVGRLGPHLPVLRRRSAPAVRQHGPRPRAVQEDFQRARPRRRSVRHRLERPLVDCRRHDVRQERASTKRSRR